MPYTPDATDVTHPTLADPAFTAAQEFRTLKAYIATLAGLGGGMNLFRKNKLINGSMLVDQINEGALVTVNGVGPLQSVDMWRAQGMAAAGVFTLQQSTALFPTSGYSQASLSAIVTTADGALAAADNYQIYQSIEGYRIRDLQFGTATAKTTTLSFMARSNTPGTYPVSLRNAAGNRSYVSSFNIAVADTWTPITIVIPGCTDGVWPIINATGAILTFCMGAGTTFHSPTLNSWQTGNFLSTAALGNLISTLNATLQIADIQLEQGNAASPFEVKPWEEVLRDCQRYVWKTFRVGTIPASAVGSNVGGITFPATRAGALTQFCQNIQFPVNMRTTPSVTTYNPVGAGAQVRDTSAGADCAATALLSSSDRSISVSCNGNAATAVGNTLEFQAVFDARL
jgi:hypothetical protein